MAEGTKFKRNRLLSVTTEQAGRRDDPAVLAVDPYESRSFTLSNVEIVRGLSAIDDARTRDDIESTLRDVLDASETEASELFEDMVDAGFLRPVDDSEDGDEWIENGWRDALEFYEFICDYPFIDDVVDDTEYDSPYEMEDDLMEEYVEREDVPDIYQDYETAERIELPDPEEASSVSVSEVLSTSLSTESDADCDGIDAHTLSAVLYFAFGETGKVETKYQGQFLTKTVPSGGARHPSEGYVAVFDVDDVPAGIYHYSVRHHALERVSDDTDPQIPEIPKADFEPSAIIGVASMVGRNMWRYREPRTYRVLFHDAGHVLETLRLVSRSYGCTTLSGFKFDDEWFERYFGLDTGKEPLFAYVALDDERT